MNEIAARAVYLYAFSPGPSRGGSGVPELPNDRRKARECPAAPKE